jgi:1-acyl-sn-glycerol-3-phosphate acyltransferase
MASNTQPGIARRSVRYLLEFVGSALLRLLSRTTISGAERVPRHGPFIIAGNHRAVMEIFLMLAVTRPHVELIGSGDFPLDPRFRFLALWYGYIPYKRGSVDGRALRRALRVLR